MNRRHCYFLLIILGFLAYANTLGHPFVHDDIVFILNNPLVHSLQGLGEVFTRSSITPEHVQFANPYYRPLLDVLYRIEYLVFGPRAWGYHALNILIHIVNGLLVFNLVYKLTCRERFATAVGILFLLHPVQTEAVACISGISNLLVTCLCLGSFLFYLRLTDDRQSLSVKSEVTDYVGTLGLFGLALLAKEQAIVLPFLLALYEFCFAQKIADRGKDWRLRLSGFGIIAGGYLLWRKVILGGFTTAFVSNFGEFVLRLRSIPGMVVDYLRMVVFPIDLHYYRSYDILSPWILPCVILLVIGLVAFRLTLLMPLQKRVLTAFGFGWFLIALMPTSLVPLVHEYSWVAQFEHFLYLPLIGLLLANFLILETIFEKLIPPAASGLIDLLFLAVLLIALLLTVIQNRVWADELPLFRQAATYQPQLGRVRLLLGKTYLSRQDVDKAANEFEAARLIMEDYWTKIKDQRVRPFYDGFWKESLLGLAACEELEGHWTAAENKYSRILQLFPADLPSHNQMALLAVRLEKWDTAVLHFQKVVELLPEDPAALANLAVAYIHQGQLDQAENLLRRAVTIAPEFAPAQNNLRLLLEQRKQ